MSWINDLKVQLLTDEMMTAVKVYWFAALVSKLSLLLPQNIHTLAVHPFIQTCSRRIMVIRAGGRKEGGREEGKKKERKVVDLDTLEEKGEIK